MRYGRKYSAAPGRLQDLVMLLFPAGQERTERQYAALLEKAGFRLQRLVPTISVVSIVEACPRRTQLRRGGEGRLANSAG